MKYRVYTYDLWADGDGGYSVNDVYRQSTVIELADDADDACIISALKREGEIRRNIRSSSIEIDGEPGHTFYINYLGNPAMELRAETDN